MNGKWKAESLDQDFKGIRGFVHKQLAAYLEEWVYQCTVFSGKDNLTVKVDQGVNLMTSDKLMGAVWHYNCYEEREHLVSTIKVTAQFLKPVKEGYKTEINLKRTDNHVVKTIVIIEGVGENAKEVPEGRPGQMDPE
jgi:hypothetical protein